jgi:hypothetical protein
MGEGGGGVHTFCSASAAPIRPTMPEAVESAPVARSWKSAVLSIFAIAIIIGLQKEEGEGEWGRKGKSRGE